MADNRDKDGNQNKQQPPMQKPQRSSERQDGNRQQSGNRAGGGVDKGVGNENREIQKDLDTDETDEDEQGEITQRNPRVDEDNERK